MTYHTSAGHPGDHGYETDNTAAYAAAEPSRGAMAVHVTGAIASLALVAGLGLWGYKQVMRDVTGVPVVRAIEGPMRSAPEDPGGLIASHEGLSVNRVQAEGNTAQSSDRVTLAPQPVDLASEDLPGGSLAASGAEGAGSSQIVNASLNIGGAPKPEPIQLASLGAEGAEKLAEPLMRGLTLDDMGGQPAKTDEERLAGESMDLPAEGEEEAGFMAATDTDMAVLAALAGEGVSVSPRPAKRPSVRIASNSPTAIADAVASARDTSAPAIADPATVAPGTRLVQLGAFPSEEEARAAWADATGRFGALFSDKQQLIRQAEAGGRPFWRLRAVGFENLADARRFCAALVAEQAECIPVVAR
ncbi:SPOR domain-containing protein [Tropicimonas sp. IMCC34011]|uniref:SPOR domain-containing protein n=1 Tax=Tropicimonas sp. IMCC34011 TaxID=2248759 RepID=UPI000E267F9F|nr:SPOR domain-containing protein [Tropicimonas sp. IMCC34011]